MNGNYKSSGRKNLNKIHQGCIPPTSKKNIKPSDYSIQDLFKGKHLDIVTAALLLSGRLKVDSVELFRGSSAINVTLIGKYLTNGKDKTNALTDFLEENGDMTLDEVFEGLYKRMEKEKGDDK